MISSFNNDTIQSLIQIFSTIHTHDNLLVLDPEVSSIINYLMPFKQFKAQANFDNVIFNTSDSDIIQQYQNVVILANENSAINIPDHARVTVIVKNLTRSRLYELNHQYNLGLNFDSIIENKLDYVRCKGLKIHNWKVPGLVVDSNIITLQDSMANYFKQPIYQVNKSLECFFSLIDKYDLKVNNIYTIGTNSNLFVNMYQQRLVEYLNGNKSNLEQEFYLKNKLGTHDLIVIERNLDYLPVVMNQLTYVGLIDEIIGLNINLIKMANEQNKMEQVKVDDELFDNLKHLNFSLIGMKLNQLAKLIKNQYTGNPTEMNLKDIKNLIENLTDLNRQQDLVKKHTNISEKLLDTIKFNQDKQVYNEYEMVLNFQNEVFDMSYKQQMAALTDFLTRNVDKKVFLNSLVIVSTVNSGLRQRDYDTFKTLAVENYGISVIYELEDLKKYHMIQFSDVDTIDVDHEGVTGGVSAHNNNYTLLNKFWNLHPEEEAEDIDLIEDYRQPSFSLPSNTVPLTIRVIEALYSRAFLTYKPINKITRQPSWENLGMEKMFKGRVNEQKTGEIVKKAVIVFLGGITWSEVSSLKYLEKKVGVEMVVIGSGMVGSRVG